MSERKRTGIDRYVLTYSFFIKDKYSWKNITVSICDINFNSCEFFNTTRNDPKKAIDVVNELDFLEVVLPSFLTPTKSFNTQARCESSM